MANHIDNSPSHSLSVTACRFSTCSWFGSCDDLFTHCEESHRNFIKYLVHNNRYDFTFDDLTYDAFLLCGKEGLYWFCLDIKTDNVTNADGIRRGVFAIGNSETIEYTVKLGLIRDGQADYWGPYKSRPERKCKGTLEKKKMRGKSKRHHRQKVKETKQEVSVEELETEEEEIYDLHLTNAYLEFMNNEMPGRTVRIYIGDYDDSDDQYLASYEELDWSDPEEQAINELCIEKFTCFICFEFIRRNARFCERQHFVCGNCFDEMVRRQRQNLQSSSSHSSSSSLRCPMCRCDYLYDCYDNRIEELLRMVKFPEENEKKEKAKQDDCKDRAANTSKRFKRK